MIVDEVVTSPVRGVLSYPESDEICAAVLLLGPNPFLGGQPDNPVARAIAEALIRAGAVVFALEYPAWHPAIAEEEFNRQRDSFWNNDHLPQQMPQDLSAGLEGLHYLSRIAGSAGIPLALAGYSYGGALALHLAQEQCLPVYAVSPPLRTLPPGNILPSPLCALVRAREDIALSQEEVEDFLGRSHIALARELVLDSGDHFFLQEMSRIADEARAWINLLTTDC